MNTISRKLVTVILVGSAIYAPFQCAAAIWSDWTSITQLYPGVNGLAFTTEYTNLDFSICNDGTRWVLVSSAPDYRVQAAALMSAFYSEREVSMHLGDSVPNEPNCAGTIDRFWVR